MKNIPSASVFMIGGSSTGAGPARRRVSSVKKVFTLSYWALLYIHIKITGEAQNLRQELSYMCVQ